MTGNITAIEPMGQVETKYGTRNKYRVKFDNNDIVVFQAIQEFKKSIGENVIYDKNPMYGTASIVYEKPFDNSQNYKQPDTTNKPTQKTVDTQEKIVRQSMLKAAVDFHATNPAKTEQSVLNTAQLFINFINQ